MSESLFGSYTFPWVKNQHALEQVDSCMLLADTSEGCGGRPTLRFSVPELIGQRLAFALRQRLDKSQCLKKISTCFSGNVYIIILRFRCKWSE